MNRHVAIAATPAVRPAGRERNCTQCSAIYCAPRATSRYCSPKCVKRAQRGNPRVNGGKLSPLRAWLLKRGYTGKLSPWDGRNRAAVTERSGLNVPLAHVLSEVNAATASLRASGLRTVLPTYTEATLRSALTEAGLNLHFPDAIQRQLTRS